MQPCSSKGCKTAGGQSCSSGKKSSYKSSATRKSGYRGQVIQFFSKTPTLMLSNSTVLWATKMHSTLFERSDSYLLGFSLKIGMTAFLSYFISAQRCDIYLNLRGHRANQTTLAFFRILERSWPLTSTFLIWINRYMWCLLVLKKNWAILAPICSKSRNLATCKFRFTTL